MGGVGRSRIGRDLNAGVGACGAARHISRRLGLGIGRCHGATRRGRRLGPRIGRERLHGSGWRRRRRPIGLGLRRPAARDVPAGRRRRRRQQPSGCRGPARGADGVAGRGVVRRPDGDAGRHPGGRGAHRLLGPLDDLDGAIEECRDAKSLIGLLIFRNLRSAGDA